MSWTIRHRGGIMAGNTFGKALRVTTFGESHGKGIGAVVDGCPPELPLCEEDFVKEMARRRPGRGTYDSPRHEEDRVEIASGVFEGLTTGTPITLFIRNRDADSKPYEILRRLFRPGHADYAYFKKYRHFDYRGGGRASARETAARVAAGVVAFKILAPLGVKVTAYTVELGGVKASNINLNSTDQSPFLCPDLAASKRMEAVMKDKKRQGDSLGGIVEILATACPAGLGEPVFDKLDAELAKAIMSVGAVKGVEIGSGFESTRLTGSQNNDPLGPNGFVTNRAGGILGGVSTGADILLRAAVKPIPSIHQPQNTLDREGNPAILELSGRFDVSAIPRIHPVLEAMVKLVLADHYLRWKTITQ